jgi:hypothetical protein
LCDVARTRNSELCIRMDMSHEAAKEAAYQFRLAALGYDQERGTYVYVPGMCLCSRHVFMFQAWPRVVNNYSRMLVMSGENVALSPLNMRLTVVDFTL